MVAGKTLFIRIDILGAKSIQETGDYSIPRRVENRFMLEQDVIIRKSIQLPICN